MENTIKTLDAMRDLAWDLHKAFKKDRKSSSANHYFGEYQALDHAIRMLSDPAYAKKMQGIFLPGA